MQYISNLGLYHIYKFGLTVCLKYVVIQPQDLELKHLEFHLHLCPFQMIKTSFVLKLVHCVLSSIINT